MKARIKNYLSVTKKEWNGMIVLVILIALVLAAPYVYQVFRKDTTINFKDFDKAAEQLSKAGLQKSYPGNKAGEDDKLANPIMFAFNPNGLTVAQWKQLGLSEYQANIIKHFEAKGGRFYGKDDVKKIYGITADDYKRLEPYINILQSDNVSKKVKPGQVIELNSADSAKLTELNGIGPSFALRIISYRGRLGGFYYKEQLKEIYGLDSLKYAAIKDQVSIDPARVKKIAINAISFEQLRIFPYLGYKQVNAIIQYRVQHGNYASMADMKNIAILDDGILRKIEPYLIFK
ncbi:MAG: competence protein ComEA [Mucilaginibacter sp.]|nr:competence protein ComEA [Mucilaginibacter sp.]